MKLAVICGARLVLRRWSRSNCERPCQRILCVRKKNVRFETHIHGKTNLYFRQLRLDKTAETNVSDQREGRQQSFTQAAPNELKLGEGGVKW